MKLETFFEKFDQFADAPDAVAKMRELVLQLAVQGKLVAQTRRRRRSALNCSAEVRASKRSIARARLRQSRLRACRRTSGSWACSALGRRCRYSEAATSVQHEAGYFERRTPCVSGKRFEAMVTSRRDRQFVERRTRDEIR